MKKILIIINSMLILIISHSCSEDFFVKEPPGATGIHLFKNEKGIEALVMGAYGSLNSQGRNSSILRWTHGSAASDDAYKGSHFGDAIEINQLERWEVMINNSGPNDNWAFYLAQINRTNEALKVINQTEGLAPAVETQFRSELRFLRALYYFELWLAFGNVPIINEEIEDPTEVSNINPESAVLEFITNDLDFAWNNLPETQTDVGRPTKYAAMGLAAMAYMQELEYDKAKPLLDNIINSGRYHLVPNFFDNYRIAHNNNEESIFELQAAVNDAAGTGNANFGNGLIAPHGGNIGMCCGFHQPSQNLVNAYKVDENGLPMSDNFNDTDLKNDQGVIIRYFCTL